MAAMPLHAVRQARGFTWIEILMVIAALAILAAMVIPGMMETILKKQVKEAMALADVAKKPVQSVYSATGKMPPNNQSAGAPPADKIIGNLVKTVAIDDGAVTITFGNNASKALEDRKLTIRPAYVNGQRVVPIAWVCHTSKVPAGMDVAGMDVTDVPAKYLPLECRP